MKNDNFKKYTRALLSFSYARGTLLTVIILTVVNILISILGSEYVFVFSAAIPYYTATVGYIFVSSLNESAALYGYVLIGISVLLAVLYLLFYFLSKKHYGWLIGAFVLFGLDTLSLVFGISSVTQGFTFSLDGMMLIFHVAVEIMLVVGISGGIIVKRGIPKMDFTVQEKE